MALVEQAVFTSAETDRSAGYQVVAASGGVCEVDARELAIWGPSHDSLLELGPETASVNFHPLPSGAYCVSRTAPAGWEYSGRGGHRVYTQCLIVPPEVLSAFANNPFAVVRAATAGGMFQMHAKAPKRLEPLELAGRAAPVDQSLLARLAANPGPHQVAALVQAALDSSCLAVAGSPSAGHLIAGLFSCVPPECRREFSFSTGLKFSSRRSFRIVALSGDKAERRWVAHQPNVTVLEVSDGAPAVSAPMDGWARFIERVLASGRTSFLAAQLSKRRFDLSTGDLPALGLQLLEDLDASAFLGEPNAEEDQKGDSPLLAQRAHAAHQRFEKSSPQATASKLEMVAPSKYLKSDSPKLAMKLEYLDDLVYEAIGGQVTALEQLQTVWPEVLAELGDGLLAESREQYLRYALSIWEECVEPGSVRNPARAVQALEVLCTLFDEA